MRTILRLLGTSADAADRTVAIIRSISASQWRDVAFGLAAATVILIDIAAILAIAGVGQ